MAKATIIGLAVFIAALVPASVIAAHDDPLVLRFRGQVYPAAEGVFTTPIASLPGRVLTGRVVWTGSDGCDPDEVPPATAPNQIALVQRGDCLFVTKAQHAQARGYTAFVVANHVQGGDTVGPMGGAPPVDIPGVFVGYSTGEVMKRSSPTGALQVRAAAD